MSASNKGVVKGVSVKEPETFMKSKDYVGGGLGMLYKIEWKDDYEIKVSGVKDRVKKKE